VAEKAKAYRTAKREHIAARESKWQKANKEHVAEKAKAYRSANKDKMSKYQAKWYKDNKERVSELGKAHRAANYVRTGGAGQQADAPVFVYIMQHSGLEAAKVGEGPQARIRLHERAGWKIVQRSDLMRKDEAQKLESKILDSMPLLGWVPAEDMKRGGHTETFPIRDLDIALTAYQISKGI
jgi:hypothetical protein